MIAWFARHPTAGNLLMGLLVIAGILAIPRLERESFPDFSSDLVEITVVHPGATALEIEESVCAPIEEAVEGIESLAETVAVAQEGVGRVTVEMASGGDFATFLDDVKTEVDAIDEFPDEAEAPIIRQLGRTEKIISVAVSAPVEAVQLKRMAEELADRLRRVDGVSQVSIRGFSDHQLRVELPQTLLNGYGITVSDVAAALADQSLDVPAGTIATNQRDVIVRFAGRRRTATELADVVIASGATGAEIRLGDVATISEEFEDEEVRIEMNGVRAAVLEVRKSKSQDALRALESVRAFVEAERVRQPRGVKVELTEDSTSIVADRLSMLVNNGSEGLIFVFLAMWLFFSWRYSFWVAMGLPVSFMGAFFLMTTFGQSINMITMVGMLLALGLLMDDAIVIAENIAAHRSRGKGPLDAAIAGAREVKIGVFSSFITTVCVFGPLTMLEGQIGKVLLVMPIVLILVLAVSLVEAFLILPGHLGHALAKERSGSTGIRGRIDGWFDRLRDAGLGRAVDLVMRWPGTSMLTLVAALAITLSLVGTGRVPFKAFPDIDGDIALARVLMPQGTPLSRLESVVKRVTDGIETVGEDMADRQPAGEKLVRNVVVEYGTNTDAGESGAHVATVTVDLLSAETRDASMDEILRRWREAVGEPADVINLTFTEPGFGPAGRPIEVRLLCNDSEVAAEASRELRRELSRYAGVVDLADDFRPGKPEVRIRMRDGADVLGIDARTIATQLRAALQGRDVDELQTPLGAIEVAVRAADENRDSLDDLEDFQVRGPDGTFVPLGVVARLEAGRGLSRISRIDGRRTITVTGDIDPNANNSSAVTGRVRAEFMPVLEKRFPRVEVEWQGEAAESAETGRSLMQAFLLGLIGIYFVLSFQFRGWIEPFVVMIAIPFAFIGVVWGHLAMGLPLTMPSMMGFISLAGVVVNDSIILVEFLKMRIADGLSVPAAACQAARERFRAVLLTSLTTIVGLVPLLFEKSLQAQVLVPLAASIVFGLAASTVMVLVGIPMLYASMCRLGIIRPNGDSLG